MPNPAKLSEQYPTRQILRPPNLCLESRVYLSDVVKGREDGELGDERFVEIVDAARFRKPLPDGVLPHQVLEAGANVGEVVLQEGVNAVSKTVQQGAGEPLRAEDVGPFVERQVGGDEGGPSIVALGEDLKVEFQSIPDGGTKPSSSMMSSLSRASFFQRLSRRRSSVASVIS